MSVARNTAYEPANTAAALRSKPWAASLILTAGLAVLLLGMAASISFGVADIAWSTVWEAVLHYNPDLPQHQIIHEIRLPRVLGAALVGASLAVAGAIMQGVTRNPMADSGLLGLNAGAGLAMAICMAMFPGLPFMYMILYAFMGAGLGAGTVFGLSSAGRGGMTPIRLVLAGAAVSALLAALSEGIALYYRIGQDLAFWFAGGVAGIKWLQVETMLPWMAAALVGALLLSKSVTLLSLGDDVATGLGQRTLLVKAAAAVIVIVLAGASVSVAGAVSFIGLVVPHVTRALVGVDYRWVIPCSAVLGSLLMTLADLAARMVNPPVETPVGAIIALLGVPFFLYLTRRDGRGGA
jgi:iron complex transport system permease protein